MGDLSLLLLLTLSLPSSAAVPSLSQIFMDASNCVHLRCEWRGVGKQCKSVTTLQKDGSGYYFKFLKDDESDDDLLTRIKNCEWVPTSYCGGELFSCIGRTKIGLNALTSEEAKNVERQIRNELKSWGGEHRRCD
ncbi:hypothetical protein WR25_05716 [Diploscapter pachys]|uniref:Uncharacterized protein n=1 Tax=Diploscapter pachys TaxID=2018661 RepID=A0A2A2LT07_9BILA|nr:hypothetical protein WR25_05716 [Diploscapter pachys]